MNRESEAEPSLKEQVKAHFLVAPVLMSVSCVSTLLMVGGSLIEPFGLIARGGMGVTLFCAMGMLGLRPSIEAQMYKLAAQRTKQRHAR